MTVREPERDLQCRALAAESRPPVDPTILDPPSSTTTEDRARDPELSSTKKGRDWSFGMKAHIGVDVDSGVALNRAGFAGGSDS